MIVYVDGCSIMLYFFPYVIGIFFYYFKVSCDESFSLVISVVCYVVETVSTMGNFLNIYAAIWSAVC